MIKALIPFNSVHSIYMYLRNKRQELNKFCTPNRTKRRMINHHEMHDLLHQRMKKDDLIIGYNLQRVTHGYELELSSAINFSSL